MGEKRKQKRKKKKEKRKEKRKEVMGDWIACEVCGEEFKSKKNAEKCQERHEAARQMLENTPDLDDFAAQEAREKVTYFFHHRISKGRNGKKRFSIPLSLRELKASFACKKMEKRGESLLLHLIGEEIFELDENFLSGNWRLTPGKKIACSGTNRKGGAISFPLRVTWKPKNSGTGIALPFVSVSFSVIDD